MGEGLTVVDGGRGWRWSGGGQKEKKALGEGTLCMSVDSSFFVPRKAPSRALSRELFCTPKSSLGHFRGSFFVPQKAP